MGGGWYDTQPMLDLIEKLNKIGERSIAFDRSSTAEVAVVIDEYSNHMMKMSNKLSRPLIFEQLLDIGKIGAPVDYILLDDLDRARPYKLYIFLNAFHVKKQQKAMIDRLSGRGAKAFLWVYAPGYAGSTLDVTGCRDLTGLKIGLQDMECPLQVKITENGSQILPGVKKGMMYGTSNTLGPLLYGDDPSADVLGLLYGHGLPGLITKEIDGIQVYYSAAPKLSSPVIRGIALRAGVHIYNLRDDVLYANTSFISLHTAEAGARTIRLPKKTCLYDVYNEKEIARDVSKVTIDLPVRHTVLYFLGTLEEWVGKR